jgi:DNA replication protein DnaC
MSDEENTEEIDQQWLLQRAGFAHLSVKSYQKLRFATFRVMPGNREALKVCREFVDGFLNRKEFGRYPFIWLYGTPGVGKTHLCHAVAWELIEQGVNVRYYQAEELFDELRAGFNPGHDYDCTVHFMKKVPLLIIDDVGAQAETAWSMAKLDMLIDARYREEQPLLIASNTVDLPARIVDRLKEGWCIQITGQSQRGKYGKQSPNA